MTPIEAVFTKIDTKVIKTREDLWDEIETIAKSLEGTTKEQRIAKLFASEDGQDLWEAYNGLPTEAELQPKVAPEDSPAFQELKRLAKVNRQSNESEEKAFDRILQLHPELYLQYLSEIG